MATKRLRVDYGKAAATAAATCLAQAGLLECRCAANNIVREFLL